MADAEQYLRVLESQLRLVDSAFCAVFLDDGASVAGTAGRLRLIVGAGTHVEISMIRCRNLMSIMMNIFNPDPPGPKFTFSNIPWQQSIAAATILWTRQLRIAEITARSSMRSVLGRGYLNTTVCFGRPKLSKCTESPDTTPIYTSIVP